MTKPFSRRDFLKLGALSLGGLAFTSFLPEITQFEDLDLVRVATQSVSVYKEPSDKSLIVGTWPRDSLIHIYDSVKVNTPGFTPVWYRVFGGYMNAARLQRVKIRYNQPLEAVPETGLLAEVTVPYAQAYINNRYNPWKTTYRLYFNTVHWIKGIETGPDGQPWYRILDELDESIYYAPAVQLRPIPPEEIEPLSPDIPFEKKRIEVAINSQTLACFEYDKVVFTTTISSGLAGLSGASDITSDTPFSDNFHVQVKMPSKHMGIADLAASIDDYVLPGVPWDTFFTEQGHAFHGTYWHDNFGIRMSHGCVNMRTEEAKWLFRWTRPPASFDEIDKQTLDRKGYGTLVQIHA